MELDERKTNMTIIMSERMDEISVLSDLDDDSISNIIIEQIDINEIVDYIDQNCHECTAIPWTNELLFPSTVNGEECTEQNFLKYIDSKSHKKKCRQVQGLSESRRIFFRRSI